MTNFTTDFAKLLTPETSQVLWDEYKRVPTEYDRIFNILESQRNFETDAQVVGLGLAKLKPEGTPVEYDAAQAGYNKTYTHDDFGLGYRVTKNMFADDLSGKIAQQARSLGFSAKETIEIQAAALFNNGFSTVTGGNGSALFSTTQALKPGGTASNRLSTNADLALTSLEDAIVAFEDTTDDRGLRINQRAVTLAGPSGLRYTMKELVETSLKPNTNDNNINPVNDLDLKHMVWHYLTDDKAWFLLGDRHFVNFYWRERPQFDSAMDFDTGDAKFKMTYRHSLGHSDWRGVYGSSGV
jgi:phage major head subunit gpT-like protein